MKKFETDGITFLQEYGKPDDRGVSDGNTFVLVKTDLMLDFYRRLAEHNPRTIMEIGMFKGGSMVWYDKLYKPDMLVGIDLNQHPIAALENYRKDKPHIKTYYGRHQEKPGTRVTALESFPYGIDLVVDDASHLYAQTKATFEMLFPMIRPGGHYVIEDWRWAHQPAYQGKDATWADQPAMSNLILELVIMAANNPAIDSIHVESSLVCVRKGRGDFDADMFDMTSSLRGRAMPQL